MKLPTEETIVMGVLLFTLACSLAYEAVKLAAYWRIAFGH
jgi:hypothetical protein